MGKHRKPEIADAMRTYEKGYRKPPVENRFKPGNKANPRGRPRKADTTSAELFNIISEELVPAVINGKRRFISKREYIFRNVIHQAMKSEPKAEALFLTLHERYRIDPSYEIDPRTIGDADRAILERYLHEASQGAKDAYDPNGEDDDREFK